MNSIALANYLLPFQSYFDLANVNEICINRPGEIWVEQAGSFKKYSAPILTESYLWQFTHLVAEYNSREISAESPTLSSTLPNGLRVQFVVPPACEKGSFVCSIRQKGVEQLSLSNYFNARSEHEIRQTQLGSKHSAMECPLREAYSYHDFETFLKLAITSKKNIIISGGTSTGKTTLLNALMQYIPLHERIITIESDREVICPHENAVHLLAAEEGKSVADITMLDLLKASLRLRPDRILVSELRAEEAFPYLRAINTGHPGSITTLHADSPAGCFDQLAFMVIQGGSHLSRQELIEYAKSIIQVIVQIKRTDKGDRYISEIYFNEAEAQVSSSTLKSINVN
jgi:type IV secretion system protein VirB11